jgi:hypothetical protein
MPPPAAEPEATPFWAAASAPPVVTAPSPLFAPPPVVQAPVALPQPPPVRARVADDLPDMLDGRTRSRRAVFIVLAIAILALLGTIGAAIASNLRPT